MTTNGRNWQRTLWSGRSRRGKALLIVLALLIVFGAIGALGGSGDPGSSDDDVATATTSTDTTTTNATTALTTNAAAEEPSSDCVHVPEDLVAALEEGFNTEGTSLRNAFAVRSDDLANAWYISGDLEGPGLDGDDEIATWAKGGDLEVGGGLLIASNAVAREFSDWGEAAQPGSQIGRAHV